MPTPGVEAQNSAKASHGFTCSVNSIAGCRPPTTEQGPTRAALFVSAVNPLMTQAGAFVVPLFIWVRTTKVAPGLNVTLCPSWSPKILNSTMLQFGARLSTLSGFDTE